MVCLLMINVWNSMIEFKSCHIVQKETIKNNHSFIFAYRLWILFCVSIEIFDIVNVYFERNVNLKFVQSKLIDLSCSYSSWVRHVFYLFLSRLEVSWHKVKYKSNGQAPFLHNWSSINMKSLILFFTDLFLSNFSIL